MAKTKKQAKLPDVQVGQVWVSMDPRDASYASGIGIVQRKLEVIEVRKASKGVEAYAKCLVMGTTRHVKIKLRRFKPGSTGYKPFTVTVVASTEPGYGIAPTAPVVDQATGEKLGEIPVKVEVVSEPSTVDPVTGYGPGGAYAASEYPKS